MTMYLPSLLPISCSPYYFCPGLFFGGAVAAEHLSLLRFLETLPLRTGYPYPRAYSCPGKRGRQGLEAIEKVPSGESGASVTF